MKKIIFSLFAAIVFLAATVHGQLINGSDNANNYTLGQNLNAANAGTGFSPWSIVSNDGGGNFAGAFVGNNLTQNGRQSIGSPTQVIGLFANPAAAFVDLRRGFVGGASMSAGNAFSWQGSWSWSGGNRGFSLYSGSDWTGELLNLSHSGSDALNYTVGASSGVALNNIFNQAFTITLTLESSNSLRLQASTGSENFNQTFTIGAAPTTFKWYFSGGEGGANADNFQPYVNNFTTVPEPSTYALLGIGALALGGYVARRRARK